MKGARGYVVETAERSRARSSSTSWSGLTGAGSSSCAPPPRPNFERTLIHPENGVMSLDARLAIYAWHGRYHVAHVTALRERAVARNDGE